MQEEMQVIGTRERARAVLSSENAATKPVRGVGSFFAMALDTLVLMFKPPFAWREFLVMTWFVARVSILPTLLLSIPFVVLATFIINILILEFGAADFSGSATALAAITQLGPIVTVLVVAGAGATAMCADLGARTIREELDAIEAKRRESAEESAAEFRKAVAKREKARRDDEYAKAHGMP